MQHVCVLSKHLKEMEQSSIEDLASNLFQILTFSADSAFENVTNPNPLERPVSASVLRVQSITSPNCEKYSRMSSAKEIKETHLKEFHQSHALKLNTY
jgi:hypothetical protein